MEPNTAQMLARIEKLESLAHRPVATPGPSGLTFGASTVVWRPGGVTAGNVYATWPEVVAAVSKMNGDITIGLDTDLAPANIPVGAWDLRPAGVSGPVTIVNAGKASPFSAPFFTILAGATTIHGLNGLNDTQVLNRSTVPVIVLATNAGTFTVSGRGAIFNGAGAAPFISVTGGRTFLLLKDISTVDTGGGTGSISVTAPGILDLYIADDSSFGANQLIAAAGNLVSLAVAYNGSFATQAATAPLVVPGKGRQSGSTAIDGATGKTPAIAGVWLNAGSRIECTQKIPVGDGGAGPTVRYAALNADRVLGAIGAASFKISALTIVGGGATNANDGSTIDWMIVD